MLTTQEDETSIIERIKVARGTAEPTAPTDDPSIVDVSEDTTDVETEEFEEEIDENKDDETLNENENIEELESELSEELDEYLDLDGEEVSLSDIRNWKSGNMRQSDYTKKTTELEEQRKAFDSEKASLESKQSELSDTIAKLESVIETEELTQEELKELREFEPDEYIKYTEKQQKRKDILNSAKSKLQGKPSFNQEEEQKKLWSANPQWVDNGAVTDEYKKDLKLLESYTKEQGLTPEQFAGFDSTMLQITLDAARMSSNKKKDVATAKRVRKAPVMTKPKAGVKSNLMSEIDATEKRFKRTGSVDDAVKLRKLKSKLNN